MLGSRHTNRSTTPEYRTVLAVSGSRGRSGLVRGCRPRLEKGDRYSPTLCFENLQCFSFAAERANLGLLVLNESRVLNDGNSIWNGENCPQGPP